jgi:hypothetical protein
VSFTTLDDWYCLSLTCTWQGVEEPQWIPGPPPTPTPTWDATVTNDAPITPPPPLPRTPFPFGWIG